MDLKDLKSLLDLGFAVGAIAIGGVFIAILLKYILSEVVSEVKSINGLIAMLSNRIRTMNNDLIKIDTSVSSRFGLRVDTERLSRADGKTDARSD